MSKRPARGTVTVAMTHRRSKGAPVGTLLKPDPDKPIPAEPESHEFVERPRKAPDIYISRPELGPKR
jgi:hypothetical protein